MYREYLREACAEYLSAYVFSFQSPRIDLIGWKMVDQKSLPLLPQLNCNIPQLTDTQIDAIIEFYLAAVNNRQILSP